MRTRRENTMEGRALEAKDWGRKRWWPQSVPQGMYQVPIAMNFSSRCLCGKSITARMFTLFWSFEEFEGSADGYGAEYKELGIQCLQWHFTWRGRCGMAEILRFWSVLLFQCLVNIYHMPLPSWICKFCHSLEELAVCEYNLCPPAVCCKQLNWRVFHVSAMTGSWRH